MKKFYTLVSHHETHDGFEIHLDGRAVKTPSGKVLCAPNQTLAEHMVREWSAQTENIIPDTMPLTQILTTRIDRIAGRRDDVITAMMNYFNTDLLCYRAEKPEELIAYQEKVWAPFYVWYQGHFGQALQSTQSLVAIKHDDDMHQKLRAGLDAMSDDQLCVAQLITNAAGSVIIALGFNEFAFSPNDVMHAIYVEEDFKAKLYNEDKHGLAPLEEEKRVVIARDLKASALYLKSL